MRRIGFIAVVVAVLAAVLVFAMHEARTSRIPVFTGRLRIAEGEGQRPVLARAVPGNERPQSDDEGIYRGVSGAVIARDEPGLARNEVDAQATYDVMRLPFVVRLDEVAILSESTPLNRLVVGEFDSTERIKVTAGQQIDLGGDTFTVETVRPWSGLFRHATGEPMADVAVRRAGEPWIEHLFIRAGDWATIGTDFAILHEQFDSENAMRDALARGLPGLDSARWGVAHGDTIDWLGTPVQGSGLELDDGTQVTLVAVDENHAAETGLDEPAIRVEVTLAGHAHRAWYRANGPAGGYPSEGEFGIRFEYRARMDTVCLLYAWREGHAALAAYVHGAMNGQADLRAGERWTAPDGLYALQLDDVRPSAVPVREQDSSISEVVLRGEARLYRIREDELARINDLPIRFEREHEPPIVAYRLSVLDLAGVVQTSFSLGTDERFQYQDWRFAQDVPDRSNPDTIAVLRVEQMGKKRP